jgi:hypothetical protein
MGTVSGRYTFSINEHEDSNCVNMIVYSRDGKIPGD